MSVDINLSPSVTTAAQYVGMWFTFKKMGMPGWKGIIPYYNYYLLFKEHASVREFWKYVIFQIAAVIAFVLGYLAIFLGAALGAGGAAYSDYYDERYVFGGLVIGSVIAVICGVVLILGMIALLVFCFISLYKMYVSLAAAFGLGKGWAWGLLFVPFVFFPILGFSKQFVYFGKAEQNEA